jgi:hypothetical protein
MTRVDPDRGHVFRVGRHWYLDTALLQAVARRLPVEPMDGGYQVLAPSGLVRCLPTSGERLPGQSGALFRCQAPGAGAAFGDRLRDVVVGARAVFGGEWDVWPSTAPVDASSCGCTTCRAGGACPCDKDQRPDGERLTWLGRLIVSETLGTVAPRPRADGTVALFPAQRPASDWACGRFHECIGAILRFHDVSAAQQLGVVTFEHAAASVTWDVVLDRQRTRMLGEILDLCARFAARAASGAVAPSLPPRSTPGHGAWEMAAELAKEGHCEECPYRLGTNLRCRTCRAWQHARRGPPSRNRERTVAGALDEQSDLRAISPVDRREMARAIDQSLASNPHEPLTDAFFVRLERDVLLAARRLGLSERTAEALIETAELIPFESDIDLGVDARRRSP